MSSGTAPSPCAPSSSTGTPVGRAVGVDHAARDPGHVRAGDEPRARADLARELVEGHLRTRMPWRSRAAASGASTPGCSSSLVTHLVARREVEGVEHDVDAVGRGAGQGHLAGLAAEQPRPRGRAGARCVLEQPSKNGPPPRPPSACSRMASRAPPRAAAPAPGRWCPCSDRRCRSRTGNSAREAPPSSPGY